MTTVVLRNPTMCIVFYEADPCVRTATFTWFPVVKGSVFIPQALYFFLHTLCQSNSYYHLLCTRQ